MPNRNSEASGRITVYPISFHVQKVGGGRQREGHRKERRETDRKRGRRRESKERGGDRERGRGRKGQGGVGGETKRNWADG